MNTSIAQKLNQCWRLFATGLSFFFFGFGGVMLGIFVFPLLLLIPNTRVREKLARDIVRHTFRLFIGSMKFWGVLTYEFHGAEKLNRGRQLIIANHPTLIDVVFLVAHVHDVDCIVKSSLRKNPFTMGPVRASGYIANSGDGEKLMNDCIKSIHAGNSIIIFPEGTRSVEGKPITMQRGAYNIALRGQFDLTPVIIRCTPPTLAKGEKWYNIPPQKPHFFFKVEDDFAISPYLDDSPPLAVRKLTQDFVHYFTERRYDFSRSRD